MAGRKVESRLAITCVFGDFRTRASNDIVYCDNIIRCCSVFLDPFTTGEKLDVYGAEISLVTLGGRSGRHWQP